MSRVSEIISVNITLSTRFFLPLPRHQLFLLQRLVTMSDNEERLGILLGSEDSATTSPAEDASSDKGDGSLSFGNASEGETVSVDEDEEDGLLNFGYLTETGYVHSDGREETWYHQEHWTTINPGPRGPPAVFLPGQSCAEFELSDSELAYPHPVAKEEEETAAAITKLDHEVADASGAECTCTSFSGLPRLYDDAPYFDHENGKFCCLRFGYRTDANRRLPGWWVDPSAKDPTRSMFRFSPDTTKQEKNTKKRKLGEIEEGGEASSNTVAPLALSSEVVVPSCDLHYPITGIVHDTSQFVTGSRFLKQVIHTRDITPSVTDLDEDMPGIVVTGSSGTSSLANPHTNTANNGNSDANESFQTMPTVENLFDDLQSDLGASDSTQSGITAHHRHTAPLPNKAGTPLSPVGTRDGSETDASDASLSSSEPSTEDDSEDNLDSDSDGGIHLSTIHYIDQARRLRLIERDPRNPKQRKMNIHAPPASWNCYKSISKLNRWRNGFRDRRRVADGLPKVTLPKRNAWSQEELDTLRGCIVDQLVRTGTLKHKLLLDAMDDKWPGNSRSYSAICMTIIRYKLVEQARKIVYGEDVSDIKEQADEDAENGEADLEDNDDETEGEDTGVVREEDELSEERDEEDKVVFEGRSTDDDEVLFEGRETQNNPADKKEDTLEADHLDVQLSYDGGTSDAHEKDTYREMHGVRLDESVKQAGNNGAQEDD